MKTTINICKLILWISITVIGFVHAYSDVVNLINDVPTLEDVAMGDSD